ncbi:glycosyltransferase family 2 protein [Flagellimonas onchidii]|uniref:glycosyltransferase family 2 protein n=1 Tax=Flagellimonas onchidii TaxID=2562684 RepID=UPI0010A6666F|nr:glycosyltransferase family 2 protein [Allomuricauda onchidii]
MRISIIIPAHNEEAFLAQCLDSFAAQTVVPHELIIVDDNSGDRTYEIASHYAANFEWVKVVQRNSLNEHIPGKKVVDAFNFGLSHASDYDLIGKFDADIILPPKYFEFMLNHFQSNWKLGMCSGLLYIKKGDTWAYENISGKNHIRGPIKLYHKACFDKIEGLRPRVGWDTVDVLLAKYNDFETHTDPSLQVKHLRPTGHGYSKTSYRSKGEALYRMRYGIVLAKIAALKMAWQAKSLKLYLNVIIGYLGAIIKGLPRFVTPKEGSFIRKYRWKGIMQKL